MVMESSSTGPRLPPPTVLRRWCRQAAVSQHARSTRGSHPALRSVREPRLSSSTPRRRPQRQRLAAARGAARGASMPVPYGDMRHPAAARARRLFERQSLELVRRRWLRGSAVAKSRAAFRAIGPRELRELCGRRTILGRTLKRGGCRWSAYPATMRQMAPTGSSMRARGFSAEGKHPPATTYLPSIVHHLPRRHR
jgi:hypothetical protein